MSEPQINPEWVKAGPERNMGFAYNPSAFKCHDTNDDEWWEKKYRHTLGIVRVISERAVNPLW